MAESVGLMHAMGWDYRQAEGNLWVASDIRRRIGLEEAPSRMTLWRAERRFSEEWLRELNEKVLAGLQTKERDPGGGVRALAADSTGLGEHARGEWFSFRFGRRLSVHQFRKLHVVSECRGERRGLIRAWALTAPHAADNPMLRSLLDRVEAPLGPVLGDAAYAGRRNVTYVTERGGGPFFPPKFRWTARSRGHPAWRRMILRYRHHPGVFHETYRFRANVERAFSAIQRHQGPFLRARSAVMQRREAGWRMIARNVDLLARARAAREVL
jgi:hypothetical protein